MKIVKRVPPSRHVHDLPGAWRRWRERLGEGSAILCDCGTLFELRFFAYSGEYGWEPVADGRA